MDFVSSFCLAVPLSAWGFGSLMAAIGKVRGWNTKVAFWVAAISSALFVFITVAIVIYAAQPYPDIARAGLVLLTVQVVIGILSPLGILFLRWRYPDPFKTLTPGRLVQGSSAQVEPNKEPVRTIHQPVTMPTTNVVRSGHIFLSYRRSDSADVTGRIYDRLIGKFGKEPIFKDVDSIPLGLDFKEYLDQKVGECDVLLAIIGDHWLDASDSSGNKRLEDPNDFVRIEIESALERGVPVIPLLVRGANMPDESSLPPGLRKLVYRNGIPIRPDPDFHRDMDRLISALEKHIP